MSPSEEIVNNFEFFRTNPNAIQRYAIELLEKLSEKKYTINDPSNPFVFLLEASAMLASTAMNESKSRVRELYPSLAIKPEDIYRHMSDRDYLNQFSIPGKINMSLVMSVKEIIDSSVKVSDQNYKKITIPKDSIFSISDYDFGIHYPIDIRVTAQDGLQVVYDTSNQSPLKSITDNKIDCNYFSYNNQEYINIDLPMEQFSLTSHKRPLNVNVGFNQLIEFSDNFYYCRVFTKKNNQWMELETTHSKEVFDLAKVTAQLTVLSNKLQVTIPILYFTNSQLGGELRIDVYTTKGEISVNLGNFSQDNSRYQWRDLNSENKNIFSSPLGKFTYMMMYSTSIITGGGNGESFAQIRDRVVSSRARRDVPIRYSELEVYLADRGYQLIRAIDNITDRVLLAAKRLPSYGDNSLIISGSIENVITSEGELNTDTIINHGNNFTFFPNGLYERIDGVVKKLPASEENRILSSTNLQLAEMIKTRNIFYNPLHYSLDKEDNYLTFTPYMLSSPTLKSRWKVREDTQAGYQLASNDINVIYDRTGYKIQISTIANKAVKELPDDSVFCQLSFSPQNDSSKVFLNAKQIGTSNSERVFEFKIDTDFDINREGYIAVEGFSKIVDDDFSYRVNLNGTFNLTFAFNAPEAKINTFTAFNFEQYLGHHLVPKNTEVLTVERLEILLGESLDLLLSDSRLSVTSKVYDTYETDIPATYKSQVYQRNSSGALDLVTDPDTGRRVPVIIHNTGDPILDENGDPTVEFKKGDVKLENGKPVILKDRTNLYFLDILLINAIYLFSTVPEQEEIFNNIPKMIADYLKNELTDISNKLLERTEIFYTPKRTMGHVQIQVSKAEKIIIESSQGITIDFFVSPTTNADEKLKETLENIAKEELMKWINNSTLSLSILITALTDKLGDSIIGVNVYWQGALKDIDTFTIVDPQDAINIKQELVLNYDDSLEVKDAINIQFIQQGV